MRTVTTANTIYEINEADKLIRRVSSTHAPTPRQAEIGEWQPYRTLGYILDGLIIVWGDNPDGTDKATWTSRVLTDITS